MLATNVYRVEALSQCLTILMNKGNNQQATGLVTMKVFYSLNPDISEVTVSSLLLLQPVAN